MICYDCFWNGQCTHQRSIPISQVGLIRKCDTKQTVIQLKASGLLPLQYKSKKGRPNDSITPNAGLHV
jgi:hypothetical protein